MHFLSPDSHCNDTIFNRPGVARAVLQTALALIQLLIHKLTDTFPPNLHVPHVTGLVSHDIVIPKLLRARDLKLLNNLHHLFLVCHMSVVMCQMPLFFLHL